MTKSGEENVKKPLPICFALDQEWSEAKLWIDRLGQEIWGFKVGSILFSEQGPQVISYIKDKGSRVFLDLKYHDIPNTVGRAVHQAFSKGVDWVTVHACGGSAMLKAAAEHQSKDQLVFAVSVLTSFSNEDLKEVGVERGLEDQVKSLAQLARNSGVRGLVCSAHELEHLKERLSETHFLVPGIRWTKDTQDQKRTMDPKTALRKGANTLVVGRGLYGSQDWEHEWENLKSLLVETS